MYITLAVGIFFLVLALAFGLAARSDYLTAQRQWRPAGKTRRRVAVIFALVGLGLVLSRLLS
jgi:hypothetical protein